MRIRNTYQHLVLMIGLISGVGAILAPLSFADDAGGSSAAERTTGEFNLETLDDELFEGLDDGEDIQFNSDDEAAERGPANPEQDRATQIGEIMDRVRELLEQQDLSQETRDTQKKIVRELTDWLKELEEQQKKSQQQPSPGDSKPKPGSKQDRNAPQQANPSGQDDKPGNSAAQSDASIQDSSKEIRDMDEQDVDFALVRDNIEEFWGGLPEKDRELLRQIVDMEPLPEFAPLIRRYFRRLAEDQTKRR